MSLENFLEKKENFFNEFASLLDVERASLSENVLLNDLDWDSMAVISTIALVDEIFDIVISGDALINCATISDIFSLIDA